MKVIEVVTGKEVEAEIKPVTPNEISQQKKGWKFNWREILKIEEGHFFKLYLPPNQNEIEGLLMISIFNEELVFMNNLEIAPHNYGSMGRYDNVAGCLLAYACLFGLERGKGNYNGFLVFDSKTQLIQLYQKKYGAEWIGGQKMIIPPSQGKRLIQKYLENK